MGKIIEIDPGTTDSLLTVRENGSPQISKITKPIEKSRLMV